MKGESRAGFPGERHIPGYNFCGPGTNLRDRLARGDSGINAVDAACREHDIAFNRKLTPAEERAADRRLIDAAAKHRWTIPGAMAVEGAIRSKMVANRMGVLPYGMFAVAEDPIGEEPIWQQQDVGVMYPNDEKMRQFARLGRSMNGYRSESGVRMKWPKRVPLGADEATLRREYTAAAGRLGHLPDGWPLATEQGREDADLLAVLGKHPRHARRIGRWFFGTDAAQRGPGGLAEVPVPLTNIQWDSRQSIAHAFESQRESGVVDTLGEDEFWPEDHDRWDDVEETAAGAPLTGRPTGLTYEMQMLHGWPEPGNPVPNPGDPDLPVHWYPNPLRRLPLDEDFEEERVADALRATGAHVGAAGSAHAVSIPSYDPAYHVSGKSFKRRRIRDTRNSAV